jgi:hypothetical protein
MSQTAGGGSRIWILIYSGDSYFLLLMFKIMASAHEVCRACDANFSIAPLFCKHIYRALLKVVATLFP